MLTYNGPKSQLRDIMMVHNIYVKAIRTLLQERVDSGRNASIVVGLLEPDGSTNILAVGAAEDAVGGKSHLTHVPRVRVAWGLGW